MAFPSASPFSLVPGVLAAPIFAEVVAQGHSVESNGTNKRYLNVFHFRRRPSIIPPTMIALIDAWQADLSPKMAAALSVAYVADVWYGRFMDDPASPIVIRNVGDNGTVTGDRMPSYGAVTIQLKGGGRGRNYRGSKHFGPIAESQTLLDNLTAGATTLWDTVASAIIADTSPLTDGDGNEWDLFVMSQSLSNLAVTPVQITGAFVNDGGVNAQIGTMNRRKQKRLVP